MFTVSEPAPSVNPGSNHAHWLIDRTAFYHCGMDGHLPLPTLLSHVLVAFTVEFDNEFEHQMPHRTTNYGSTAGSRHGPWLASMVSWSNCLRFVGEDGVRVGELEKLAARPRT